jgi:hypothetical protein
LVSLLVRFLLDVLVSDLFRSRQVLTLLAQTLPRSHAFRGRQALRDYDHIDFLVFQFWRCLDLEPAVRLDLGFFGNGIHRSPLPELG